MNKNKIMIVDEFDNLEESKIYQIQDYIKLHENYKPTNKKILGIVEGKSFVLDGVSRNGRFYPKQLWENALKNLEVKEMLRDRLMFGCIGHPENYTLDELLAEGKVSHIVTDIKLGKDGFGYATYEILDTPAGRILETILKAGSKMKVSTRGFGEFSNEAKQIDGKKYQVIDPNTFQLESIDFVIKPGIASVDVKLVEELEKNNKEDIEKLKESKIHLCEDGVCTIISEMEVYENLKKENKKLQSIIKNLKEENNALQNKLLDSDNNSDKDSNKDSDKDSDNYDEKIDDLNTIIVSYIEYFLKDNNMNKNLDDIRNTMLDYLEINDEDINSSIIEELLNKIESYDDNIYIENLKKYLNELKEILDSSKNNSSKNDIITKIIDKGNDLIGDIKSKELEENYNDIIKDFTIKLIKESKEKNNINKSLSKSLEELKKSYFETLKLLKEEKSIREIQEKHLIEKEKHLIEKENKYNELLELKTKLEESVNSLNKKIIEEEKEKHKLKIEYKLLKESKIEADEKLIFKRVNEEINKIKKDIKEKLVSENKIYLELQEQKLKEKIKNEFLENIEYLKEKIKEKENDLLSANEKLNKYISSIDNYKDEIKSLKESLTDCNTSLIDYNNRIEEKEKEIKDYQIKYLESLYKIDRTIISETLNNYKNVNKVKEILETRQQKNKKSMTENYGMDLVIKKEIKENKTGLLDKLI